ncbi:MAG: SDR family oxidoreductase [Desulfobacter sp.]|nr:MAG: SDR family oxidoreductase [Desulfobacter sp.]
MIDHSKTIRALAGKNILLTGATGFIGKVVLEKLLRTLPGNGKIYLILRPNKKYESAQNRLHQEVLASSIFDLLKQQRRCDFVGMIKKRVRLVAGECTEACFNMDPSQFSALASEIDIIVHSAASVNFREPLDTALKINTLALENLIRLSSLAGDCPLVHVSTCYVHGHHKGVCKEENVVPKHAPEHELMPRTSQGYYEIGALLSHLETEIRKITKRLPPKKHETALIDLGIRLATEFGWNDTYTFTKWMGEQLLIKAFQGKSLTILRPSIVESALTDPEPGWIEGVKVTDALILAYAREKVMLFPGNTRSILDIIPVDLVANSIIMSSAEALCSKPEIRIYQCSSSNENPIKISFLINTIRNTAQTHYEKFERLFYRKPQKPFIMIPRWLFRQLITAGYFIEQKKYRIKNYLGLKTSRKSLTNFETTLKLALVFSFYTSHCFTFLNEQLLALSNRMGEIDQALFPVSASQIDWRHYLSDTHLKGLNKYALKPKKLKRKI